MMANWSDIVTWVNPPKAEPLVFAYAMDTLGISDEAFGRISADNYTVEPNCTLPDFIVDPGLVLKAIVRDAYRPWYSPGNGWRSDSHYLGYDGEPLFSDKHPCGEGTVSNIMDNSGKLVGGGWCLISMKASAGPVMCVSFRGNRYFIGPGMWQTVVFSTSPLNADTIGEATKGMASFTTQSGKALGIKPTHLLTFSKHPEAEALAVEKGLDLVYLGL